MKLTKEEKDMLGCSHDIDFKYIDNKEKFKIYKIVYSYKTIRNNKKENIRYVPAIDWESAFTAFDNYVDNFNNKNKHRKISNVEILDFYDIGTIER